MPLPRWLARLNRRVTNPVLQAIPRRISPFAILYHRGRKTGRGHRVPVAAFDSNEGVVIPPTYGPEADWVRNILAAGSFQLDRRGTLAAYGDVRLISRQTAWPHLPWLVRGAMRVMRIQAFVAAKASITDS